MASNNGPSLEFEFQLNDDEKTQVHEILKSWLDIYSLVSTSPKLNEVTLSYQIIYDENEGEISQLYTLNNLTFDSDILVLRREFCESLHSIVDGNDIYSLDESIVINENILKNNIDIINKSEKLNELLIEVGNNEEYLSLTQDKNSGKKDESGNGEKQVSQQLKKLLNKKKNLEEAIKGSDFRDIEQSLNKEKSNAYDKLRKIRANLKKASADKEKKNELREQEVSANKEYNKVKKMYEILTIPLENKYTESESEINLYIQDKVKDHFEGKLPEVTFWEHSKEYVLQSEYEFEDILSLDRLNDMPRPLINIFRLSLGIRTLADIKNSIKTIQSDLSERRRIEKLLSKQVNEYIKNVWKDYDQEFHIGLEKERISFQITDPGFDKAHFYNMEERSQGCQTFISFLLTIGAEANRGVIKNSILLLDEPEAHLHPTGVRFMLEELIKISSKNNNVVFFATHSGDMIDNKNYDRHIIVKKEKEKTILQPSKKERIGYFMQEEVLYGALDIDLSGQVASKVAYNFVFEGDGDVQIFEHFYRKVLRSNTDPQRPYPIKNCRFYQGGKCNSIRKYFKKKPIQLGTKWCFILDNDKPATGLKEFLEGMYKNYLNKDIFIFQYPNEFEDLLPSNLLITAFIEICKIKEIDYNTDSVEKIFKSKATYNECEIEISNQIESFKKIKGKYKEVLNRNITESIKGLNNEEEFNLKFSQYNTWAKNVIEQLSE